MHTYRLKIFYKENGTWKHFHDIVTERNVTEAIEVSKAANHYEFDYMQAYIDTIWIERNYRWEEIDWE